MRALVECLHDEGVSTLYVGDTKGVLGTHWSWSPRVTEKTHNFWAYRRFINRLKDVCEEYGIMLEEESEAWTSQECPGCGKREGTVRHRDSLTCPCGFEGHAELVASESFLRQQNTTVGSMARPVPCTSSGPNTVGGNIRARPPSQWRQRQTRNTQPRIESHSEWECRSRGSSDRLRLPREESHEFSRGWMSKIC